MDTNSAAANQPAILPISSRPQPFHYGWAVLGVLGAMLIAWVLRKIFWQKDSN